MNPLFPLSCFKNQIRKVWFAFQNMIKKETLQFCQISGNTYQLFILELILVYYLIEIR